MTNNLTAAIKKVSSHQPPHLGGCENNFIRRGSVRNPCNCGMDDLINATVAAQKRVAKLERRIVAAVIAQGVDLETATREFTEEESWPLVAEAKNINARIRREKGGKS